MTKSFQRIPKNYDGTKLTTHHVKDLLPTALANIGALYQDRPGLILAAWPAIIGPQLAAMTQAIQFKEGILWVKVNNSSLYSILSQHDRARLLRALREQFPQIEIKNISFRIG